MKKKSVKSGYSGAKTIYIRKLRFEEAQKKLEKEIQEAFLAGETFIEVVHGIGEGILKKLTLETIRTHVFFKGSRLFPVWNFQSWFYVGRSIRSR